MSANALSVLIRSAVLFVIVVGMPLASSSLAAGQATVPLPVLASATTSVNPAALVIRGEGFTPGGDVFIAILDPWGGRSYETRWTTASEPMIDMFGPDDPDDAYRWGGVVVETFDLACGHQVTLRAYDKVSRSWSNVFDVAARC